LKNNLTELDGVIREALSSCDARNSMPGAL